MNNADDQTLTTRQRRKVAHRKGKWPETVEVRFTRARLGDPVGFYSKPVKVASLRRDYDNKKDYKIEPNVLCP